MDKKNKYNFYLLPHKTYLAFSQQENAQFLLLECQPYGNKRFYRIATLSPENELREFACKDSGRTSGWFQCFLGSGIYKKGRIKLSKELIARIEKLGTGTVTQSADTWAELIESFSVEYKKLSSENEHNGD